MKSKKMKNIRGTANKRGQRVDRIQELRTCPYLFFLFLIFFSKNMQRRHSSAQWCCDRQSEYISEQTKSQM